MKVTNDELKRLEFKKNIYILVCLFAVSLCSILYYGIRVLSLMLVSVAVSVISSWISNKLRGKIIDLNDISPVVSGAMFACLLPPSASYWTVLFGALFSQIVILFPFGGKDNCHINETAAAFCFCAISWSGRIFRYPLPFSTPALFGEIDVATLTTSPGATLKLGGKPIYSIWEMILGAVPGAIGTTSIIVLLASLLFLYTRKNGGTKMSVITILSFFIFSLPFNRTNELFLVSSLYELFSGALIFAAVFLVPQSEKHFETETGKVLFSMSVGIFSVLFRIAGGFEEPVCFSLLLCSLIIPFFDRLAPYAERLCAVIINFVLNLIKKTKGVKKVEKAN